MELSPKMLEKKFKYLIPWKNLNSFRFFISLYILKKKVIDITAFSFFKILKWEFINIDFLKVILFNLDFSVSAFVLSLHIKI